jgi:sugar/nucleoside kinase (ribokinase family)
VLVFGTLAQRDPRGLIEWRAACGAAAKTCVTACDLNLRPGQRIDHAVLEAIAAADILKLNDRELAALRDELDWSDPIAELRERARVVAVTHGAAGATLYGERGDVIEVPGAPAAPGGDNVGCGDAFFAVLIHGLSCGADLTASGRAAARYAAAVAEQRGATPTFEPAHIVRLVAELA